MALGGLRSGAGQQEKGKSPETQGAQIQGSIYAEGERPSVVLARKSSLPALKNVEATASGDCKK